VLSAFSETLDRIKPKLRNMLGAVMLDEYKGEPEPAQPCPEWEEFIVASGLNHGLEFTPDSPDQATVGTIAHRDDWYFNRPHIESQHRRRRACVAAQLTKRPTKSEVLRVTMGLPRLEQEGRATRRIRRLNRAGVDWELAHDDAS